VSNQGRLHIVLEAVKKYILEIEEKELYKKCNIEILIDSSDAYRVALQFDNCMGEIIVNQPDFAPYKHVKIEMLSSIDKEIKYIFVWHDNEKDTVEEILLNIKKGFDIANDYR